MPNTAPWRSDCGWHVSCRKRRAGALTVGPLAFALATACVAVPALAADADTQALSPGAAAFQQKCAVCHTPEVHVHGLSLKGIVGRQAGSVTSFDYYSPGMKAAGFKWDPERLSAFLADPGKYIPGSAMKVSVPDAEERAALVTFLTHY